MSYVDEEYNKEIIESKKNKWMELKNFDPLVSQNTQSQIHLMNDGYFCQSPDMDFSHFVIQRIDSNDSRTNSLFEINALLAICQLEQQIISVNNYEDYCQRELFSNVCCKPWSLPNYIALLSNKTSCFDIEPDDIINVQNILLNCFEYFYSLKLSNDCQQYKCRGVPNECTRYNSVFNILHYLSDINFIKFNNSNVFLKYSMIFIPIAKSTKILQFFNEIEKSDFKNNVIDVVAMDLGLKNAVFDERLVSDCWLVGLGAVFVTFCMWIYTSSIFITIMTVIAIFFSLGIAYFTYFWVFDFSFFPFMNLLAVVVLIGIGADNSFLFVKIWQCNLSERIKSGSPVSICGSSNTEFLTNLMASTLRHTAVSMFVTSLTTAGAFYASFVSSITSVKCFGIFAGTAVLSNYIFMVTWLPASVSMMELIPHQFGNLISNLSQKIYRSINQKGLIIENFIMNVVNNFPILWITLFGFVGICSCFTVFYWPRLQLPESQYFQLFVNNHPFELYDTKFKDKFWFEKSTPSIDNSKLPLRFVWGVLPNDNGDYTDPSSKGTLLFDNNFNVSTLESQIWLLNFCKRLKLQPFYQTTFGLLLPNCFIENFISWMNRRCIDTMNNVDRTPCCEISKFPYEPHIFDYCLPKSISSLYATPREYFIPGVAGPKFTKHPLQLSENKNITLPPIVKGLVIEYESNYSYSMSYLYMKKFFMSVELWFREELKTAPPEMQNGWFISDLNFFDLQNSLTSGTINAIIIAMCTSLIILFLVTLNVLVSLYAALTVFFIILTTIAILTLLEWKLNILESVSISTAIGLAIDYSLHYGMQYCLSPNTDRVSATGYSLSRIIGPSATAAITTGAAGAFMLPSNVLPYIQIGVFLVVIMTVSWTYSTLFLMSILRLIGPQYGFLQFNYSLIKGRKNATNLNEEVTNRFERHATVSEHLLTPSSSAVGDPMNSESHELDSLTSNSLIKTIKITTPNISNYSGPAIDHFDHNISSIKRESNIYKDYPSPSNGSVITVVLPDDSDGKI